MATYEITGAGTVVLMYEDTDVLWCIYFCSWCYSNSYGNQKEYDVAT